MRAGDTPLVDAARHGRAADVVALLAGGADVNEPKTDGSGTTALYIASQEGHAEIATKLLAANADVNQAKYFPEPARARAVELLRVSRTTSRSSSKCGRCS